MKVFEAPAVLSGVPPAVGLRQNWVELLTKWLREAQMFGPFCVLVQPQLALRQGSAGISIRMAKKTASG